MQSASSLLPRIKQLCNLGIDGQTLAPTLLRELHEVIPSWANTFMWVDARYAITNMYDESPDAAYYVPLYLKEFHDKEHGRIKRGCNELPRTHKGVTTTEGFVGENFYSSELYHEILRPMNYHHSALIVVQDEHNHVGVLALHRCKGDADFTDHEKRLLADLMPHIAHGLNRPGEIETPFADSGESGLLVFNQRGTIEYMSPQGSWLLFLATHPTISATTVCDPRADVAVVDDVAIPPQIKHLCDQVVGLANGDKELAAPPVWRHSNPWGGFTFRAYWLKESDCPETALIGITIERQVPLPLKLSRRFAELSLTPKQTQIAMLLIAGQTYNDIAERLHISTHTVIDHVRKLQEKLDVSSRSELVAALMTG